MRVPSLITIVLSFQRDNPLSLCIFTLVVFTSSDVIFFASMLSIIALFICASPIRLITELENSVVRLPPLAEPNIRVFTFSTPTVRSLTFPVIAVKSFVLNCSNSPETPLRLSIVAYLISAILDFK